MNGGSGSSGGGSFTGTGGGSFTGTGGGWSLSEYILTMGEYDFAGTPVYGYIGPIFATMLTPALTTITPGELTPNIINGKVIDSIYIANWGQYIMIGNSIGAPVIVVSEGSQINPCILDSGYWGLEFFECSTPIVWPYTPGEMRSLRIVIPPISYPENIIDAPLNQDIISDVVTASISSQATISITNGELRVNGWAWVTSTSINDTDQIEYRTQVTQKDEVKTVSIYVNSILSNQWMIYAHSCYTIGSTTITWYDASCGLDVTIPATIYGKTISAIWSYAFNNVGIQSVVIPSTITNVGIYAFAFNQLTSLTIPSSITTISYNSFRNNQISSIVIPNSITSIEEWAFVNNQLTSVTIPSSVTNIGGGISGGAFQYNQLTSITIPSSVTNIGERAFQNNELTSVTLPSSITNIGSEAFRDQTNSLGNGTVYGPISGYVYDEYYHAEPYYTFDKTKLPNYIGQ
jgi:hypothetical protein